VRFPHHLPNSNITTSFTIKVIDIAVASVIVNHPTDALAFGHCAIRLTGARRGLLIQRQRQTGSHEETLPASVEGMSLTSSTCSAEHRHRLGSEATRPSQSASSGIPKRHPPHIPDTPAPHRPASRTLRHFHSPVGYSATCSLTDAVRPRECQDSHRMLPVRFMLLVPLPLSATTFALHAPAI
jgi:hypothetical protein